MHVADGVDVNEEADAGDDEEHDERKLVEDEAEIDVEGADGDPGMSRGFHVRQRERVDRTAARAAGSRGDDGTAKALSTSGEGAERRENADGGDETPRQPGAEDSIEQEAGEGQQRNQPEMERLVHSFIRSMRSTASVARARKTAMMMARPTAASAAATIMTKKTKIWPFTACH